MARRRLLHINRIWQNNDNYNQKITEKVLKKTAKEESSRERAEEGLSGVDIQDDEDSTGQNPEALHDSLKEFDKTPRHEEDRSKSDVEEAFERVMYNRQKKDQDKKPAEGDDKDSK
ncbi:hypothetical protein EC973_003733 [Apophysomyces ossiformis]|uniref:Uncharacterized protein n=1 Tax=Apophysomyces ossiformis TaxID=679940 RepID=A0A8H7BQX5_9FUNG|nr:hypothetical protein EC973_003733 [Apophysomyces ossiformis]